MVDLIHDRLQRALPHRSDWPAIRPTVVRLLLEGDYDDYADYYDPINHVWTARTTWKDLHPGHLPISSAVVNSALANIGTPTTPTAHAARPTTISDAMDACIRNLSTECVIALSPSALPPTMSLFLKPKDEHTARVICDLRPLNGLYPRNPPAFRLPSIGGLVSTTRGWPDCYFTKLDISAYFHSLSLSPSDLRRLCPPNMPTHPFVFHYKQQSWVWIRLPFGWSWAPALAQQQMTDLVSTALLAHPAVLGLVYYDDVLLACTDPTTLSDATHYLVNFLGEHNLKVAQHKCCLTPQREIDWIGKHVGHYTVRNTDTRARQLAGVFMGLTKCHGVRVLRRLLGWVSWYSSHFPGANRALSSAYAQLHGNVADGLSWSSLWAFCLCITLGSVHVQWCRNSDGRLPLVYTDACAANGTVGLCDQTGTTGATVQIPELLLAPYARASHGQQTAELYGVAVAVAAAVVARQSAIVVTDNSACVAWFHGARIPATRHQTHLLLAASLLTTLSSIDCTVQWIEGKLNPADPWSRQKLHTAPAAGLL